MKRISQRDLQNMYEPMPQKLKDEMDLVLSSLDDREEKTTVKKKISVSFVLAAVLIIASMVALAASNMNVFRIMTNTSTPILPLDGAENMIKTNIGSVENEYVTLTVEEALYDGQSVMTLVHITPKDIEKYAMLNAFFQGTPEKLYSTEIRPVKAPEGTEGVEVDGIYYELINEADEKAFKINGEAVEIPNDQKTAEEKGYPVYVEDGVMYYADQFDFVVTGRKDGREMIYYWVNMSIVGEDAENAEALGIEHDGSHSMDAEELADGSVLVWSDRNIFTSLPDTVKIKVRCGITVDGQEMKLDDLIFELDRTEEEKKIRLVPENGKIGENIEIHSAEISFTKLRGNLTVDYTYVPEKNDDGMGIFVRIYDAEGNRIADGTGETWEKADNRYVQHMEMQSLNEIPDAFILEAYNIGGETIGRCTCKVVGADNQ